MSDANDLEASIDQINEGGIKTTASKKDLDAILQSMLEEEDEDQPIQTDASSYAHSDMSSLLPFGNVIPSDCEQSISTGPLDEKELLQELEDMEDQGLCLDGVYIDSNTPPPSTSYGSYFNRRRASDHSLSSNESNSLSSILDSVGWRSRKQKVHHSRGLKKEQKKGFLYNYLSSHSDSAHHERESPRRGLQRESSRSLQEQKLARTRAFILVFLLCTILFVLTNWAELEEEEELMSRLEHHSTMRPEGYSAGMSQYLGNAGVPKGDARPGHAQVYYDELPKDSKGNIVRPTVPLPDELSFVSDPFDPTNKDDTPLFWIVPRSGAGVIRTALSTCDGVTIAGEFGVGNENELKIIDNGNFKYVNVETFTLAGLARSKKLNLVGSKLVGVVTTPLFRESLKLFDDDHHARAFTLLRHPLDRAVSTFEKFKKDSPDIAKDMSLEYYARSQFVENNYLVRYLSGTIEGQVSKEHLSIAKGVMKKFLIGFSDDIENAMLRFEKYYGFKGGASCRDSLTKTMTEKSKIKQGSEAWRLLQWQNVLDLELYNYAKELYRRQGIKLF
jgi:hypothetical protein